MTDHLTTSSTLFFWSRCPHSSMLQTARRVTRFSSESFPCWILLILWWQHDSRRKRGFHFALTADCQLRELLQAGSSLPAWSWLAAHFGGWKGVAQMPILFHVAVGTKSQEILKRFNRRLPSFVFAVATRLATGSRIPFRGNSNRSSAPIHQRPRFVNSRNYYRQGLHFARGLGLLHLLATWTE
jgi:hypothetical protein